MCYWYVLLVCVTVQIILNYTLILKQAAGGRRQALEQTRDSSNVQIRRKFGERGSESIIIVVIMPTNHKIRLDEYDGPAPKKGRPLCSVT